MHIENSRMHTNRADLQLHAMDERMQWEDADGLAVAFDALKKRGAF